jgi:hypothetical protein
MTKEVQDGLQGEAAKRLKDFDGSKLFCGATHTHCGPSISYERTGPGQLYDISNEKDVMTPQQYILLLYERVGAGLEQAWQSRAPAGVSWGLGHAAVGYNRRLSYADGSAIMGFDTARPDFSHVEGSEDHAVEMLFFWDSGQKLTGMLLNIACPSQVGRKAISADFWHPLREGLKAKYGPQLHVFAQCAAAGDQCPESIIRNKAEKVVPGQTDGAEERTVTENARRPFPGWHVAAERVSGLVSVLRCARQLQPPAAVPRRDPRHVAPRAAATQPTRSPPDLGQVLPTRPEMAADAEDPASVSQRAVCQSTSKVRTVCGSSARTGLCGGWLARAIPTASTVSRNGS